MATSVDCVTEKELEVAEILRDLPETILCRASMPFHLLRWGAHRRRVGDDQSLCPSPLVSAPAPAQAEGKAAVEVDSPNTPLAFSASEVDAGERSPPRKRKLLKSFKKKVGGSGSGSSQSTSAFKQTFKELNKMLYELNAEQQSLLKELSRYQHSHQDLQQVNSNLHSQARLQSNSADSNPVEAESRLVPAILPAEPAIVEPQPADVPSANPPERPENDSNAITGGRNKPWFILPDLNCTAEEAAAAASAVAAFESQYNRATNKANAAEARRRRIEIIRSKNKLQRNR